ncbi:MAG: CocE/NonD family hydrolase [Clostridiales Family XIII bacterium]|jgi:predicted acyl esterase|nr:CocE/NonD family hydrolase [Clostridiales Family XIII bacterium]
MKKGIFAIVPVCGLEYETKSSKGLTDEEGAFRYEDGETVTFSVGGLALGSAPAAEELTPADLSFEAGGSLRGLKNRRVTNISRLLLSLDPAGAGNGRIAITDDVRRAVARHRRGIWLDASEALFENESVRALMEEVGGRLCPAANARNALRRRIHGIVKDENVKVPLRGGGFVYADVFRPVREGRYPVVMSYAGYGKAFWFGKNGTSEEYDLHERMEDDYFEGVHRETDYINFHIQLAGGDPVPPGAPGFPPFGSKDNPMLTHTSEFFERANTMDFVPYGYVVIVCDSEGLGASPGMAAQFGRPEAEGYYDAIEWAAAQPWSNGNVGLYGGSYYAMNAMNVASLEPPSLKAMVIPACDLDAYRDICHPGGLSNKFGFTVRIADGEWQGHDLVEYTEAHPFDEPDAYHDQAENAMKIDPSRVKVPFWTALPLEQASIHTRGAGEAFLYTATPKQDKKMDIVSEVGVHYWMYRKDVIERHRAFFDHWLKGDDNGIQNYPRVSAMVRTGGGGYDWIHADEWPLPGTEYRKLYLAAPAGGGGDGLLLGAPGEDAARSYAAGPLPEHTPPGPDFGLRFVTEPFAEDTDYAGYAKLRLFVSSTAPEMALVVFLRVLDEDGEVVPVVLDLNPAAPMAKGCLRVSHRKQDEVRRTEYRPFHTHREADRAPLVPGEAVECEVEIFPATMRIRKGWRLLLEIQPPGVGEIYDPRDDYSKGALNQVHMGARMPSYLQIPVVRR